MWMFIPVAPEQKFIEEIHIRRSDTDFKPSSSKKKRQKSKITAKEKMIITFLYVFIAAFVIMLGVYIVMSFLKHPNLDSISDYLKYFLSTLVGFFIGTNKERE
jgi:hypothetical protein